MELGFGSGFVTEGLLENLQVSGSKPYDVCDTACKLFIVGQIMIVKTPDHKKRRLHFLG